MKSPGPASQLSREDLEHRARAALAQGNLLTATSAAKALVLQDRDRAPGYFILGIAAAELGQFDKAVPLLAAAVERGSQAEHVAQLARVLSLLRRDGEAADAAHRALALEPDDPHTLDTIGCVLTRLGDHERAAGLFRRAVAAETGNLEYRYNLAAASGFIGDVAQARAQYEAILEADACNARAHYGLALLNRQTPQANHVPRLKAALARTDEQDDALRIRYALAKELDDLGDPEAFDHLRVANDWHKQQIAYQFEQDAVIFDAIETLFAGPSSILASGPGNPDASPIFIVGMPRTGTTLVDRIVSSHSQVGSAGELQAMPVAVKRLARTSLRTVIDAETISASGALQPSTIGDAYLAEAAHHRPTGAPCFTDKLPANALYIGHIARALPNARIVSLRRNPMDTVWSNYKNLFASQSGFYAYSYDLMDTARYYARFARLMAMWDGLFPGRVLQLSYEELVADQVVQTKRLLEHCALEWENACLSFHENRSAVATPSAAQVRRPLNADGIGQWRRHERHLEPIRQWFEEQSIALD